MALSLLSANSFPDGPTLDAILAVKERYIKHKTGVDTRLELVSQPNDAVLALLVKNHVPSGLNRLSAEDFKSKFAKAKNGFLLVLYEKNVPIGFYFSQQSDKFKGADIHECDGLAIIESHRGQGLGGILLGAGLRLTKELGGRRVVLFCDKKLKKFYEHNGFHNYAENPRKLAMCAYLEQPASKEEWPLLNFVVAEKEITNNHNSTCAEVIV